MIPTEEVEFLIGIGPVSSGLFPSAFEASMFQSANHQMLRGLRQLGQQAANLSQESSLDPCSYVCIAEDCDIVEVE